MPTLFARLDAGLAGNDVSVRLTTQTGNLTAIGTTVAGLVSHPPQSLADLGRSLAELPLPNFQLGGDFASSLNGLRQVIPGDISSVTGTLTAGLQQLQSTVDGDLAGVLQSALDATLAVYRLTQIDWTCSTAAGPAAGPGGAGGTPPGAGAPAGGGAAGAPPATPATIDQMSAALDLLPSPLNVDSFLTWLNQVTSLRDRATLLPVTLPIFDDLHDPLETLFAWKAMDANGMRDNLAATLHAADGFIRASMDPAVATLATDLASVGSHLHADALTQIGDGLSAQLGALRAALANGDLSTTGPAVAAINALLDQYDVLRPTLQAETLDRLIGLSSRLRDLPDDLTDQMDHVSMVLRPGNPLGLFASAQGPVPDSSHAAAFIALEQWLASFVDWFKHLADKIDLSAIQQPLKTVADNARKAVDTLDDALVNITLQVKGLFSQVETLLQQVDTAALVAQVQTAIQTFKTQLTQQLASLFAPVSGALHDVVNSIGTLVDKFNPADMVDGLKQVIQTLTGILQDPAVTSALGNIRDALNTVTNQVQNISFSPLSDEVIAAIKALGDSLKAVDSSQLSPALQMALQAALAILPPDLTPLTNPLVTDFSQLIDSGPAPLVAAVEQQPQRLLEQVRHFEPSALVGTALSQPFNALTIQLQTFKPSTLLQPVQGELDSLKQRLSENANPGQAIRPLEAPFNELMQAFDRIKPDDIIKPLQDAVSQVIKSILSAVPLDEVFHQVDAALQKVKDVVGVGSRFTALLQRVHDLLDGFGDAAGQVNSWVEAIIGKVDSIADMTPIQQRLTELSAAIDSTKASALTARFSGAADPLLAALDTLNPSVRLTALVQAYREVSRQALAALPNTPAKTAVTAALDRFDPLQPAFSAPFQALGALRQGLAETKTNLSAALADWDARYHADGSALSSLKNLMPTSAQLHQWLHEALAAAGIVPAFSSFFAMAAPVRALVGSVLNNLKNLTGGLQTKLTNLLLGPDSLGGIRDAMQSVVQRLRNFNLGFLADQLKDLFAQVRAKLDAISPAKLAQILQTSFTQMLQSLDLGQFLSAADVAALDADFKKVVDKLKTLDPGKLVIEVVQPEFEQKILPLLEVFDLTPLLKALLDRLHALGDELKAELARVNAAYQEMLRSAPSLSLSATIDIGISL